MGRLVELIQYFVGVGRLELPLLSEYASETYAYTNSATHPQKIESLLYGHANHAYFSF